MAVTWTKELFDLAYRFNAEPEGHPNTREAITLHYNRYVLYPEMLRRAKFFIAQFGLTAADRVLVVGCGFGWTVEALTALGITAVGTDVGAYIQSGKTLAEDGDIDGAIRTVGLDPTGGEGLVHFNRLKGEGGARAKVNVLNEDSATASSRNRVKTALGTPTIIITEDVVTSLTDTECVALNTAVAKYATDIRIVHFLTELANPNAPFFFNSKTLEEWKLLFPLATVVADGYVYRVL